MAQFDEVIEAQLRGASVRASLLAQFDFAVGPNPMPMYLWPGAGDLHTNDGKKWQGIGGMGVVSDINTGPRHAAEEVEFQLFATAEMLQNVAADAEASQGRDCYLYLQMFDIRQFDDGGQWVDWQPLDDPILLFWGIMGPVTAEREVVSPGSQPRRILKMRAVNALENRQRPVLSHFSDRDQKARTSVVPADNIFIKMSDHSEGRANWPVF